VSKTSAQFFKVSENEINWASIGFLFAFVVASPLTVFTLHKGPKPAILAASLLILFGNWLRYCGAKVGQFAVVMTGQVLIGLAQPFVLSAPTKFSDMWFSEKGRTSATALASLANPLGGAVRLFMCCRFVLIDIACPIAFPDMDHQGRQKRPI
jgi:FLVCR family MFS transporter 7